MRLTLVIDAGNSQLVLGLYCAADLLHQWRLSSGQRLTADEIGLHMHGLFRRVNIEPARVKHIMIASVVPQLDAALSAACLRLFDCHPSFVGTAEVKTGMAVDYKNPREVGADRIVSAVAARHHFGAPVIVMDCGTATTFDIISPEGHYAGGLILPGLEVSLHALSRKAAKLPEVSIQRCDELIGRDTVSSMQAGSYWAAVDGYSGIIRRLHGQPGYAHAPVIATGGLAHLLIGDMPEVHELRDDLTLEGLRLLAGHNC
ncbi:MAG: type III pantothenate kinase [Mariprofundaceae bacterium]